jgi:hypothetical protein
MPACSFLAARRVPNVFARAGARIRRHVRVFVGIKATAAGEVLFLLDGAGKRRLLGKPPKDVFFPVVDPPTRSVTEAEEAGTTAVHALPARRLRPNAQPF